MKKKSAAKKRSLYAWEIQEARRVFGNQINYDPIRIHECVGWTNRLKKAAYFFQGVPYDGTPNAVTLGNSLYFPEKLLESLPSVDHPDYNKMGWLIHELTHTWQYQRLGWRYLGMSLVIQIRSGASAYDFGGEDGLLKRFMQGWKITDFNLEQQGDIFRSYYDCLARGQDTSVWLPFIAEMQQNINIA